MEVYVLWNETNGWEEFLLPIVEDKFILGSIYFENENYKLIAHSKENNQFFLKAEWK